MVQLAVRARLDRARAAWARVALLEGVQWSVALLVAAALLAFHIDYAFILDTPEKILATWGAGALLLVACAFALVLRPWRAPRSDEAVALLVERRFPELDERLLSAVELGRIPDPEARGLSSALIAALTESAGALAAGLPVEKAIPRLGLRRAGQAAAAAALLLLLHATVMGPAFGRWLQRMTHPYAALPVWRNTRPDVEPKSATVMRGGAFEVTVAIEGKSVRSATLYVDFQGRVSRIALAAAGPDRFVHRFEGLTEGFSYYATAGDGRSNRGRVEVVDPPAVVGARLQIAYPDYTGKPAETLDQASGSFAAPIGSRVTIELRGNRELRGATIQLPAGPPTPWEVRGTIARGTIVVQQSGVYTVELTDHYGFRSPAPQEFQLRAIEDQAPEVKIVEPAGDLDIVPDARIEITGEASDDYGVAAVRTLWRKGGGDPTPIPMAQGGRTDRVLPIASVWDLTPLRLKPGDIVRFRVEAEDHDHLTGPNRGTSPEFQLRVVDRAEMERRLAEMQAELQRRLEELIRQQRATREQVERQRRAQPRPNPDAIQEAEQRQRALATEAGDLARQVEQLSRTARQNHLANPAELQAQENVRGGLTDLAQNAMPQAADRIAQAEPNARAADARQQQQARADLGEASRQQEEILRRLEELANQLRPQDQIQRLAERAERLARAQGELRQQTDDLLNQALRRAQPELTAEERERAGEIAQRQANLQRATEELQRAVDQAAHEIPQRSPERAEAIRQAAELMRQLDIPERQSQAAQDAQNSQLGQASENQAQAQRDLQQVAQALRQAAQGGNASPQQQLQQAMQELRAMMEQQQQAIRQTQQNPSLAQQRQLAQLQRELQQRTQELRRRLEQLQRNQPNPSLQRATEALQQAEQSLGQASQSLQQGQSQQALSQEQQALQRMQQAMQRLQQARQEMEEQDDPLAAVRRAVDRLIAGQAGLLEGTRRIDQQQAQLGQQTESMRRSLDDLARQQAELQNATREVDRILPSDVFRRTSRAPAPPNAPRTERSRHCGRCARRWNPTRATTRTIPVAAVGGVAVAAKSIQS